MLEGLVILVTGSSSGIGLGIAQAAAQQGAKILLHGSSPSKLEAASKALGGAPFCISDLTTAEGPWQAVEATLKAYGRIDGVVNNAGIFPRADLEQTNAALFDKVFTVNARAPMLVSQRAVEAFRTQKSAGSIVNIGSINAYGGQTDLLPYSMSKGAMMAMTRNLADALAPEHIRVNQLNVGWTLTQTEIETQRREGRPDDWQSKISPVFAPTGRLLTPEMVAAHVIFWLSEQSAPVTGQIYEVEQYPFIGRNILNRMA